MINSVICLCVTGTSWGSAGVASGLSTGGVEEDTLKQDAETRRSVYVTNSGGSVIDSEKSGGTIAVGDVRLSLASRLG